MKRLLLRGLLALVLLWVVGFVWFLGRTAEAPTLPERADGIVALTGGADRVQTALRLLADGRARALLISGVGGSANFATLAQHTGTDPHLAARVTLGREALSTRGNAAETAHWARSNGIRSLLVVTADYHMPRALVELGRALPEVRLYPVPVTPVARHGAAEPGGLRLLLAEYAKYLAASIDLTAFDPHAALQPPDDHAVSALPQASGG